jgi:hypothetical protein|tara:strand:- start:361 stop:501 length:141 start_codon:yes stop_codon:yes gene_type:complete
VIGFLLLAVAAPGTALADPPKIDWKTFIEQLEQSGGEDVDVGEQMC